MALRRRARVAALTLLAALASPVAHAAAATPQFSWSQSQLFAPPDASPPLGFSDVSCAGGSLCVAVSYDGRAFASTDPAGGVGAWTGRMIDAGQPMHALACPSASLCVAVDEDGAVLASTAPAAAQSVSAKGVIASDPIRAVSCASSSLCVAVDGGGDVISSIDPAGGTATWDLRPSTPRARRCSPSHARAPRCASRSTHSAPCSPRRSRPAARRRGASSRCPTRVASRSCCRVHLPRSAWRWTTTATSMGRGLRRAAHPAWQELGNIGLTTPLQTGVPQRRPLPRGQRRRRPRRLRPADRARRLEHDDARGGLLLSSGACPSVTRCVLCRPRRPDPRRRRATTARHHPADVFGEGDGTVAAPGLQCGIICSGTYPRGGPRHADGAAEPGLRVRGLGRSVHGERLVRGDGKSAHDVTAASRLRRRPPATA